MSIDGNNITLMKKPPTTIESATPALMKKASQPRCCDCSCAAFAGIKEIEVCRGGERKCQAEQDQVEHDQVLLVVCGMIIGLLLKIFLSS